MSDTFDPYYIWLGIPPEEQPPHHYRLLGVTLFEDNSEVIEAAANRQMAYMQEISAGDEHIDQAQKILGELSRARICLLNQEKKKAYDATLLTSFDSLDQASDTSQQSTSVSPVKSQGVDPLMPPSLDAPLDQTESHTSKPLVDANTKEHKRSTPKTQTTSSPIIVIVGLSIIIVCGSVLAWKLLNPSDPEETQPPAVAKQSEPSDKVKPEDPEVLRAKQEAKEARDRADAAEQKLNEQEAKKKVEAERQAKEESQRKAKKEADRKAAEEAARRAKEEEARKEKTAQEQAKRKAEEEAQRKAKEEAEQKAKKKAEEEREAQKLRNNPEALLASKGFEKKGTRWVFAKEQKLKLVTKELASRWKRWQRARPQNDADIKMKLEAYNKLLLESFENRAMRLAVREDLRSVLEEPDVAAALVKLNVKTTELNKSVKALQRADSKLKKAIPKQDPIVPIPGKSGYVYAALIIAEKESAVVQLHPGDMGQKDSPNLFILPRAKWEAAGGSRGQLKQLWHSNTWQGGVLETSGLPIRCGFNRASNPTVHLPLKQEESGTATDLDYLGGKAGANGWKKFFSQMEPHTIKHSVGAIDAARKKLDAYQPDQK